MFSASVDNMEIRIFFCAGLAAMKWMDAEFPGRTCLFSGSRRGIAGAGCRLSDFYLDGMQKRAGVFQPV
ncbi:hypothetical protein CLOSTMETH_01213 [[Clostridium] methylpentosum DSM 5476]|uniref:Uncharacterized protein n=1 Tax=[Clostridium] methylpentosum DSM 5476 TaxID=537013 RepID=C0EBJ5_9FIRM|nr:hypothetical protein CLOSTMETH_01213 [[Clostridium] methylpentosum DSM 5476]